MSTHAAVLEAGIIKRPDALKQLLRWWGLATDDERRADILEAFHRLAAALICLRFVVRWLRPALASAPSAAV